MNNTQIWGSLQNHNPSWFSKITFRIITFTRLEIYIYRHMSIVMASESSFLIAGHVQQTFRQQRCLAACTTSFHHVDSCIIPRNDDPLSPGCGGKMFAPKQQVKRSARYLCMLCLCMCVCGDCCDYMLFLQAGKKQHHAKLIREGACIA